MLPGYLCQLVIIVIPVELFLDRIPSKIAGVLFKLRIVEVLPFFVDVFGVEVVFKRRDERGSYLFMEKVIPWKVFQPRVILHFQCSVVSKSVLGLSLDHFVNEICGFNGPVSRNFTFLDLDLFLQNVVSDFFS